jgi:hypothetical protein
MRLLMLLTTLCVSSCSVQTASKHVMEVITNSDIATNAAACNQLKQTCEASRINPENTRQYTQWRKDDGAVNCMCSK